MSQLPRASRQLLAPLLLIVLVGCSVLGGPRHAVEDYTPVFAAAESGNLDAVRTAVDQDPSLVRRTEMIDAQTLLHDAAAHGRTAVVEYLLRAGADPNAKTAKGLTPLALAATNGKLTVIQPLLDGHADINAVDSYGWTPLDRAEKWHHADVAQRLAAHGGLHAAQLKP